MTYPHFPKNCSSLLCNYLTPELFDALKEKKTANGFTLEKAIKSGIENSDSEIGVYAGDEESYTLFAELFDKVIEAYHGFSKHDVHHSNLNVQDLKVKKLDEKYVLSTRIRVGRNVKGMPLGAAITKVQRDEVEQRVVAVLSMFKGELKGDYYPLLGMSDEVKNQLIQDHFLFKDGDRFLASSGLSREWPHGRGIFHNHDKTFLVWLNEEDQLRIISMQQGGDVFEVFSRLITAMKAIEEQVPFAYSERLGYISSCPTNLGTAMRASVHIKLPHLAKNREKLKAITDQYHLQIRGIDGEHSQSKGGIFDISNARRLGVTEVEAVQDMLEGVTTLIETEKALEN